MRFRDGRRSVVNDVGLFVGGSASAMVSRSVCRRRAPASTLLLALLWQSRCARRRGLKINQNDHFVGKLRNAGLVDELQLFL